MMGVAVAIMMLLAACSSMTGTDARREHRRRGHHREGQGEAAGEKISTVTRIDVDTNQGVVALNGTVSSEEMRVRAAQLARDVKGVRDVVNNLRCRRADGTGAGSLERPGAGIPCRRECRTRSAPR